MKKQSQNEQDLKNKNAESSCGCEDSEKECNCDYDCGRVNEDNCTCGCDCDNECCCDDEVAQTANEYLDMAKRIQAEFDNYRKRNQEAIKDAKEEGKASVIMSILPCADAIERAVKMTQDENVVQGLKMVENKFKEVLSSLGVTKMESIGQKFDPNLHNVLSSLEVEGKESGEIIEEYACGYFFNNRVLRFAQVVIAK
ncbi:MAG: nucleotide exchange factor GrpE [Clostridia bacterium]|nr:nucleotide exchange factor GrpE [Clostridia bacterium]